MMRPGLNLLCLLALVSCSSPPKPPSVDDAHRRPANVASAVALQSCRSDLQNTHLLALENARAARTNGGALARLIQQQAAANSAQAVTSSVGDVARSSHGDAASNTVISVRFDYGSAVAALSESEWARIADQARAAPLVVLRGRTDGTIESAAESRVARRRAEAVRDRLMHAGVEAAHVRATWQAAGDVVADNGTAAGRALNRRVEIEIYRAVPRTVALQSSAPGTAGN